MQENLASLWKVVLTKSLQRNFLTLTDKMVWLKNAEQNPKFLCCKTGMKNQVSFKTQCKNIFNYLDYTALPLSCLPIFEFKRFSVSAN
jgi:hypothetical protein